MSSFSLVMHDAEFERIGSALTELCTSSRAYAVFLVDKNGQLLGAAGESTRIDSTALASLAAGTVAATGGMASLIGEDEFSVLFHEGKRNSIHITIIDSRVILVIIFDGRSSLGLVRLRARQASGKLARVFRELDLKVEESENEDQVNEAFFSEITDEDIDRLFG